MPNVRHAAVWLLAGLLAALVLPARAQVDQPLIRLEHGQLWNSYYYGKTAAPFNNWQRINLGMDWPGFRPEFVRADVGGHASYLLTGGFWFTSRDSHGDVITLDDFAMYATSTTPETGAKYTVTRHDQVYEDGANHWLQADPSEAEELVVSEWEANPAWQPQWEGDRQHPLAVRREVRQWGGYADDQNYFILDYTLTNTSDSTLHDARVMLAYALAPNSRSWERLFPGYTSGARNGRFLFLPFDNLLLGYADDFPETQGRAETYGYYAEGGPLDQGEYLAPGYVGLKLLYASPNEDGRATHVAGYAWKPANDQQDQRGPFDNKSGFEEQYGVVADPATADNAVTTPDAAAFTRSRMWSLVSLGPWTLAPGDTIRFAWAELMGGTDYRNAVTRLDENGETVEARANVVGNEGFKGVRESGRRAQFAYDHGYDIPDAPPAPPFEVTLYQDPGVIGNVVTWPDTYDQVRDPDYAGAEAEDLAGYRLYRSSYLPLGPWERVHDVPKGSPDVYDAAAGTYTFVDTTVAQGFSYYYALTAYDTGHDDWPVDPAARFPETRSNAVPPLESSLYANRTQQPFKATIPAARELDDVLVVPNPFVARSGFVNPSDEDLIQFVNIPSPATVRIYTMRGTLVKTIDHDDDSGIAQWDQVTDYGQYAESGVYLYHVETPGGAGAHGKFAIVR